MGLVGVPFTGIPEKLLAPLTVTEAGKVSVPVYESRTLREFLVFTVTAVIVTPGTE